MTASTDRILTPAEVAEAQALASRLLDGLNAVLFGRQAVVREVIAGLLARGHVLLEGLPGLGKTQLVRSLARLLSLDFARIQFTPDLLPGDITGSHVLQEENGRRAFVFHRGPIFGNVVLADEINRASPKTQSALLEAMQEAAVTVLNETFALPRPFFVLATQNPIELEGTYPLPEAQLDRFLLKVEVRGVEREVMETIILTRHRGEPPPTAPVMDAADLERLFARVDAVHLPRPVAGYIARLVEASHPESQAAPDAVRRFVRYGASPRAAIAIAEAGRALALIAGRPNVSFDDVRDAAPPALAHRLVLDYAARIEGLSARDVVGRILENVHETDAELPETLAEA